MSGDETHPSADLIGLFHDGEGDRGLQRDIEEHLAHCSQCAQTLRELQELSSSLGDFPELEPPRDIAESVRGAIDRDGFAEDDTATPRIVTPIERKPAQLPGWIGRVAALFVIGLLIGLYWLAEGPSRRMASDDFASRLAEKAELSGNADSARTPKDLDAVAESRATEQGLANGSEKMLVESSEDTLLSLEIDGREKDDVEDRNVYRLSTTDEASQEAKDVAGAFEQQRTRRSEFTDTHPDQDSEQRSRRVSRKKSGESDNTKSRQLGAVYDDSGLLPGRGSSEERDATAATERLDEIKAVHYVADVKTTPAPAGTHVLVARPKGKELPAATELEQQLLRWLNGGSKLSMSAVTLHGGSAADAEPGSSALDVVMTQAQYDELLALLVEPAKTPKHGYIAGDGDDESSAPLVGLAKGEIRKQKGQTGKRSAGNAGEAEASSADAKADRRAKKAREPAASGSAPDGDVEKSRPEVAAKRSQEDLVKKTERIRVRIILGPR